MILTAGQLRGLARLVESLNDAHMVELRERESGNPELIDRRDDRSLGVLDFYGTPE